jgi:hypothetical protein
MATSPGFDEALHIEAKSGDFALLAYLNKKGSP